MGLSQNTWENADGKNSRDVDYVKGKETRDEPSRSSVDDDVAAKVSDAIIG